MPRLAGRVGADDRFILEVTIRTAQRRRPQRVVCFRPPSGSNRESDWFSPPRHPAEATARVRRKKALTMEGLQIGYVFQSLLQGVPLNFQTLLPFPNFIVTEQH